MSKTRVSVTLTQPYIDCLDELVRMGLFIDPQDGIREALRDLFLKHNVKINTIKP